MQNPTTALELRPCHSLTDRSVVEKEEQAVMQKDEPVVSRCDLEASAEVEGPMSSRKGYPIMSSPLPFAARPVSAVYKASPSLTTLVRLA